MEEGTATNSWRKSIKAEAKLTASSLLVPMQLQALLVGENQTYWKNLSLRLDSLKKQRHAGLSYFAEPPVYTPPAPQAIYSKGVHLHWSLPAAFRHGSAQEQGEDHKFPLLPNRWLICRIPEDKSVKDTRIWILQSDRDNENNTPENWLQLEQGNRYHLRSLGKIIPYSSGYNEHNQEKPFLTAYAPGNAAFSAAYMHSKDMFGFYDSMENVTTGSRFTYFVSGWYDSPEADILKNPAHAEDWMARLDELRWELASAEESIKELPGSCLAHATLFDLQWNGPDYDYGNSCPDKASQLGIGNTLTEALSPLILSKINAAQTSSGTKNPLELYLAARYYNEEKKQGISKGLKRSRWQQQEQSFRTLGSGIYWSISRKGDEQKKQTELSPLLSKSLTRLNQVQEEKDKSLRKLNTLQEQLYEQWFLAAWLSTPACNRYPELNGTERQDKLKSDRHKALLEIERLKKLVNRQQSDIDTLQLQLTDNYQRLLSLLNDCKELELKKASAAPFFVSKDLSLVIEGLSSTETIFSNENNTRCRTESQVLSLAGQKDNVEINNLQQYLDTIFPFNSDLPYRPVRKLLEELFLLKDKSKAVSGEPGKATLENYSYASWRQPWIPMFAEWEVEWWPLPLSSINSLWEYRANENEVGYFLRENAFPTSVVPDFCERLNGRTLISFSSKNALAKTFKPSAELSEMFEGYAPASLTLAGLFDQLNLKEHSYQLPPLIPGDNYTQTLGIDPLATVIGDAYKRSPVVSGKGYYPFGGGIFRIRTLRIIDGFGQVFELDPERITTGSLQTIAYQGRKYLAVPPKVLTPARLEFKIPEPEKRILGWLLHNYADHSLMVFNTQGELCGSLSLDTSVGIAQYVKWHPAPGKIQRNASYFEVEDPELRKIIAGLLKSSPLAFNGFLNKVQALNNDLTSTGVISRQGALSLPLGQVLAVMQGSLRLDLAEESSAGAEARSADFQFPFFTGNDNPGLFGYFIQNEENREYLQMYTTRPGTNDEAGGYFIQEPAPYLKADGAALHITFLCSPFAGFSIYTGILPPLKVDIPALQLENAVGNLSLSFMVNPLLTKRSQVKLPLPAIAGKEPVWVERTLDAESPWSETKKLGEATQEGLSFEPVELREGWLRINKTAGEENLTK